MGSEFSSCDWQDHYGHLHNYSNSGTFRQYQQGQRQPSLLTGLLHWLELSRQRRQLSQLDERMLEDIGVNRSDALQEAKRPFWDDPFS